MLVWAFLINSVLVCAVTSLGQCAARGDVPYISEVMLLCKRGGQAFVPWLCFGAFAALVVVQLAWMERVACRWRDAWQAGEGELRVWFWVFAAAAVVGFGCVVRFDWRDTSWAEMAMHKVGVVLLAFGGFGALQVVWWTLRVGDSVARVQGKAGRNVLGREVPWLSWAWVDALYLAVLVVFMVTTLVGGHMVVSVVFEYIAFAVLLGQTTWLFVLCWERRRLRDSEEDVDGERGAQLLWALLAAYVAEAVVVLVVVT